MARRGRSELKGTSYEVFIGALSMLSILNLFLMWLTTSADLDYVMLFMNAVLSVFLFLDFLYRLSTAPSRSAYFFRQFGWADLLASVPLQQVKVFRIFRIIRVIRLLRELGIHTIVRTVIHDRANSALYTLLLIGLLMLEFGSMGMLALEAGEPGANIETASDALWYSIVTMATVGYGDQYPVTNPGRMLGTVIIVVGVGIFGTLTGFLANAFISPTKASNPDEGAASSDPTGSSDQATTGSAAATDPEGKAGVAATDGGAASSAAQPTAGNTEGTS